MKWRGADLLKSRKGEALIFLATPAMDFRLDVQHVQSIITVLSHSGGLIRPYWLCGNSNIAEARNACAHYFLAHTPCDVIVWVDSDIIFSLEDFEFLMEGDEDIVIAPYARKTLGMEPVDFGHGFVRINRSVYQRLADWMIPADPLNTDKGETEALHRYLKEGELAVDYHYTGAHADMRWFGEDTGFYHWCKLIGGISFRQETRCRLGHVGRFVYGYPDQIPGYTENPPA